MSKYIYHNRKKRFEKLPKYIYQRRNGWFEIRKRVGGVLVYWGSYPSLEEAKLHRAYYIGKKWNVKPAYKANKHIIQRDDHYIIMKKVNDRTTSFGTFSNLEDARHERDICERCNWDYNEIVEWED